ncbi:MAG: biotin/lipoyl-containing protein, partial [Priestia megaterium]
PFVQVGQTVERKDVVCVIEAMKLFNEVDAGIEGKVLEILVKDGDVVEFGQPLFTVKSH